MAVFTFFKAKRICGVPIQKKGAFHDTESEKQFDDNNLASKAFEAIRTKFLDINNWAKYCNYTFADFKLFDQKGRPSLRNPEKGDFVRINISPCPPAGSLHFWVRIQDITYLSSEKLFIVFQPSYEPNDQSKYIEHFYCAHSSSTFMIYKKNRHIKVAVYGRNETPNFSTSFINKIKNTFTAFLAIAGMSKIQWKIFTDSMIDVH
ncbi:hypothetical protein [Chryseobacterium wangxinyae]|uniref:hypothetical protein n=1 Tax=Chryseobacterium sp. CY353 TaxID=2997334 RepID=UPI002270F882|nr:hypothetical protein [Chryseobacterium sp. CY353]MCY0970837.1 hypothetical protein [Chryseobacterium sp. CY353]